jgi:hypothetical protein
MRGSSKAKCSVFDSLDYVAFVCSQNSFSAPIINSFASARHFRLKDLIAYCFSYIMELKQLFSSHFAYGRLCVSKEPYRTWSVNDGFWLTRRLWAQINHVIRALAFSLAGFTRLSHFVDDLGFKW